MFSRTHWEGTIDDNVLLRNTLGEIIADNGGIKAAWDAFIQYTEEKAQTRRKREDDNEDWDEDEDKDQDEEEEEDEDENKFEDEDYEEESEGNFMKLKMVYVIVTQHVFLGPNSYLKKMKRKYSLN